MADIQSNIDLNVNTSNALASIKLLQSQISAFHTQMAKSNAQMAKTSAAMQSDLLNSINRTGKFSASIQNIKSTTESFTTALEKNKLSLGEYFRYAGASTKSFGSLFKTEFDTINKVARERVKDLQTQYIKLGRDASGSLRAIAVRPLSLDMNDLATKTAIAAQKQQLLNQMLKQGSTNLLNFGKNTQWAGRQLMVGFTIPLSIAATTAAKSYMEIEKAAIKLQRVYGDLNTTAAETRQITKQIQELASSYTQYGVAVADTMDMAAQAAAMGKTGADLLAQIDNATRLSVLGGVDQNTALETTISLTNSFGTAADKLASKVNFLNAVENQTVLNIEDMTTAIPKAAPVVKQLGGDVEDLAFFLTAMKEGGINASEGANALKSGLSSLINPSKKASEFLAGFGVNVKGIVENDKGNLKKTVVDFAKALDKIDPLNRARAIEMMFGKFQFARISTLLQNVNKEGSQASKALGLAEMSSIQLAAISRKELEKVASSPMYKFQKAMADIKLKLAPVGESFLKAVTPVIGFVSKILDGFNNMSDGAKQFAVVATVAVAGLGPILLMTFGLIANGVANIIKLFANIKSFFNKTTTASKVLGETTDYMTQEQLKAEAVAASLDQIHGKLTQTFTSEAAAVGMLAGAYERAVAAQGAFSFGPTKVVPKGFSSGGIVAGPGTSTSDSVPANLSNGEVVLSVATVKKNPGVVAALLSGKKVNIPGFSKGGVAGLNKSHLQGALDPNDPAVRSQILELFPNYDQMPAHMQQKTSFHGSLTADLPAKLNQQLKSKNGSNPATFSAAWDAVDDKMLSSAVAGGLDANDPGQRAALKKIESEIGKKAAELARKAGTAVTDGILESATNTVLDESKKQGGNKADVAKKLESRKSVVGDYRGKFTKAEYKGMIDSGEAVLKGQQIVDPVTGMVLGDERKSISGKNPTGYKQKATPVRKFGGYTTVASMGKVTDPIAAMTASQTDLDMAASGKASRSGRAKASKKVSVDDIVASEMNTQSQSASPSKKTKQAAKNMVDGVDAGLKEGQEEIKKTGKSFGATTSKIVDEEFKKVAKSAKSAVAAPVSNRVMAAPGKSQFMTDVRSSISSARGNIAREGAWIKEEFSGIFNSVKSLFGIKGKEAVTELKSALIKETPQITVAGKKMGFDYVAALKGQNGAIAAVVTSGNAKIISKAVQEYNAGGYRIAGAVSLGLDRGIASTVAKSIIAGKKLAEAEVAGVMSVVPAAAATSKVRALGMNEQGPLLPGQVRGTLKERAAAGIDSKMANFTSGKLAGIGMAASTAAFALSGIPGPVGQLASSLLPLVSISSLLAPLMTAFSGALGMTIGELVIAAAPFVLAAAAIAAIVAGLVFWSNSIAEAKKKELAQINATSTASKAAAGALDQLAKQSGGGETNVGGSQSEAALKGQSVKTLNDAQTLVQSKEFNDPTTAIGKAITGLKGVKTDKDRKAILASTARNLVASGLTPEAAAANVDALQTKANEGTKRKNIVIDTKEFTFNNAEARKAAGRENLPAISRIAQGYNRKAVASSVEQAQRNYIVSSVAADDMGRRTGINSKTGKLDPAAFKKLSKAQQAELKAIAENTKKSTKEFANYDNSVKTFSTNAQQNLKAVGNQFLTGKITLKEYKASLASVTAGFDTLDEAGKQDVLKGMRESLAVSDPVTAQIAGTIANAAQQLQFLQLAAAGGAGAIGPDIIKKMNAGDKAATAAFNAASAKYLGSAQANYKKENPADDQTGGAGGDKATDLMKPIKEGMLANKITNKFSAAGYNKDFISMLATADAATQKVYMTFKNGIPVLNAHGRALMKAFNAKVVSDYLTQQSQAAKDAKAEVTVRNQLVAAGIDYKDAVEAAKDSTLQAALASAKTKAEVDKIVGAWKKVKAATEAALTPQEQFSKITDQADAYFSAKQNEIELKFKMDPTNIANQAVVTAAEADIATKQYQQDQYNSGLNKIAAQEDVINKTYDKRIQALDAIQKANDVIAAQQKSQLTLADALSQGDIAAAARAAQEIRATSASDSINSQKDLLDKTRQSQLDNLKTSVNGTMMTRAQIEEKIKGLETEIAAIEDGRLKPAQRALELATARKDVELEALTSQQNEWEVLKSKVELANSAIKNYVDLLKQAQALAGQISGSSGSTYDPYGGLGKAKYDALVVTAKTQQASGLGAQGIAGSAVRQLLRMSTGGMVPKYFASGGYARGTDIIPAMLTPGEFVITKSAASNLGMDKLRSMNNGTYAGDSMYNYNLSVNVSGSSLDANDVARTVMDQIKRVDSQRLQGNRF